MENFIQGYNWILKNLDSVAIDENGFMYAVTDVPDFVARYIEIYNEREKRDKSEHVIRKQLGLSYEPYPVDKPEFENLFNDLIKILSD